jgi:nucleoside-diphosphate-sugar epimerase
MSIFLTGATGFVGAAVLSRLREQDLPVIALVRDPAKQAMNEATGASVILGDLTDLELIASAVAAASGVIHTASPGDATSAAVDGAFVDTVLGALSGTDVPFVHTGGAWVFGPGEHITESDPQHPPALTAWRGPVESRVRSASVRSTIVAPGIVYGDRGLGLTSLLLPDSDGVVRLIGDGTQHWTTVHVEDLADLYVRSLTAAAADAYYLGISQQQPTVREIGEAAAHGARVVTETADESRARLGAEFVDALLMSQQSPGSAAGAALGWSPSRPSLTDLLA